MAPPTNSSGSSTPSGSARRRTRAPSPRSSTPRERTSGFSARAAGQPAAPAGGVGGTDAAAAVETVTAKLSEGFSWLKSASAKVGETAIGAIGDLRSVAGGGDDGRSGA